MNPDETIASYFVVGASWAYAAALLLRKHGVDIRSFGAVLDFGCGCGRVIRRYRNLKNTRLFGTDYNPKQIAWCRQHLPFAEFGANELLPPSRYRDAQFDFVYLWSVFTHLTEEQQLLWMAEFARVIRPGGYLLISTNGQRYLNTRELPQSAKDRFRVGQLVVLNPEATSSAETYGACDVYHPLAYVKEKLTQHFAWLDGVETVHGDYHLFRR